MKSGNGIGIAGSPIDGRENGKSNGSAGIGGIGRLKSGNGIGIAGSPIDGREKGKSNGSAGIGGIGRLKSGNGIGIDGIEKGSISVKLHKDSGAMAIVRVL